MFRTGTLTHRAVAIALLVFHVLAVGRALVPGMCQTQEAAKDRQRSCCATVCPARASQSEGIFLSSSTAAHPQCPFCNLLCTAAHGAPTPGNLNGSLTPAGAAPAVHAVPDAADHPASHPVRAPPAVIAT